MQRNLMPDLAPSLSSLLSLSSQKTRDPRDERDERDLRDERDGSEGSDIIYLHGSAERPPLKRTFILVIVPIVAWLGWAVEVEGRLLRLNTMNKVNIPNTMNILNIVNTMNILNIVNTLNIVNILNIVNTMNILNIVNIVNIVNIMNMVNTLFTCSFVHLFVRLSWGRCVLSTNSVSIGVCTDKVVINLKNTLINKALNTHTRTVVVE